MTKEEAEQIKEEIKDNTYFINETTEKEGIDFETVEIIINKYTGRNDMAIKALERDIVPFDFELYQAGLMDMPKEMIEVLDKIRAEIDEQYDRVHPYDISCAEGLEMALEIIDKYKAETE